MRRAGFTLIELVVIVAIIGLLAAVISVPFSKFRQAQALQNSVNAVVSLLNEARTKTLAAVADSAYGVKVESSQATLFAGSSYVAGAATNQMLVYESPVTATYSLAGGGSEVKFARLKGTTTQNGTITLALPSGQTTTVTVSATGAVMRN